MINSNIPLGMLEIRSQHKTKRCKEKLKDYKIKNEEIKYMKLKNKIAIVVGGSTGIGKGIVKKFLEEGAVVFAVSRNQQKLNTLKKEVKKNKKNLYLKVADAADMEQFNKVNNEVIKQFKKIDVLVNSVGTAIAANILNTSEEQWDEIIKVNLKSMFVVSKCVVPYMIKKNSGSIIYIGSIFGLVGKEDRLAYCASKGAVANMTRAMALDLAPYKVRVNSICPGWIQTEMSMAIINQSPDPKKTLEERNNWHPLGRGGTSEEVAELALYLADDKSSWVTGANFAIDGGYTAK